MKRKENAVFTSRDIVVASCDTFQTGELSVRPAMPPGCHGSPSSGQEKTVSANDLSHHTVAGFAMKTRTF